MECLFSNNKQIKCKKDGDPVLLNLTNSGLSTVLSSSKKRQDNVHLIFSEPNLDNDPNESSGYLVHKSCKSMYVSSDHIERWQKRNKMECNNETVKSPKMSLRTTKSSKFVWIKNCLFCGETCESDPRHPDRGGKIVECHTSDRKHRITFKDTIIKYCDEREDTWGDEVRTRLNDSRCSYDLHTADARYHDKCSKNFMRVKKRKVSITDEDTREVKILQSLYIEIASQPEKWWNSIEIECRYKELGSTKMYRRKLVQNIKDHFGSDMVLLKSKGNADILVFHELASSVMRVEAEENQEEDTITDMLESIAKKIVGEIKSLPYDPSLYHKNIDVELAAESASPTLLAFLSLLKPSLKENSLPSIYIANIVTGQVAARSTSLLRSLSILLKEKKLVFKLF